MPHRQDRRTCVDAFTGNLDLPHFAAGLSAPFNQSYSGAAGRKQGCGDQPANSGADDDDVFSRHFRHRARKRLSFFSISVYNI